MSATPGEPAPTSPQGSPDLHRVVADLHRQVAHLERLAAMEARAAESETAPLRRLVGEERWPVSLAVAVAVALQLVLPPGLALGPPALLPALEGALGVALMVANPRRVTKRSRLLRSASIALVAVTSLANAWASYQLIRDLVVGVRHLTAGQLLAHGASIYLTNIVVFALWYWEYDRGGPVARALGDGGWPDFLFPQMATPGAAPAGWQPTFVDYLYTSYTNATAFSPTDTMPLSRWSKLLMLVQSAVALTTVGLVVARAVNILP